MRSTHFPDKGNCSTLPIPFLFSSEYEICKPEIISNYCIQDNYQFEVEIK